MASTRLSAFRLRIGVLALVLLGMSAVPADAQGAAALLTDSTSLASADLPATLTALRVEILVPPGRSPERPPRPRDQWWARDKARHVVFSGLLTSRRSTFSSARPTGPRATRFPFRRPQVGPWASRRSCTTRPASTGGPAGKTSWQMPWGLGWPWGSFCCDGSGQRPSAACPSAGCPHRTQNAVSGPSGVEMRGPLDDPPIPLLAPPKPEVRSGWQVNFRSPNRVVIVRKGTKCVESLPDLRKLLDTVKQALFDPFFFVPKKGSVPVHRRTVCPSIVVGLSCRSGTKSRGADRFRRRCRATP
jgi:hypothetical protein